MGDVQRGASDVADDGPLPLRPWLDQNRPNPFGPGTVFRFGLPAPDRVRLAIHELSGREVAVVFEGSVSAGRHLARWEGRDASDRPVAAGTYLARLVTRHTVVTCKILLVR